MWKKLTTGIMVVFSCLPHQLSRACADGGNWEDHFYSFFDQEAWMGKDEKPFLLNPYSPLYSDLPRSYRVDYAAAENLNYWMDYFPTREVKKEDVAIVLYHISMEDLDKAEKWIEGQVATQELREKLQDNSLLSYWRRVQKQEALEYFKFARQTQGYRHVSGWGIKDEDVSGMKSALKEATARFGQVKDPFLKQRYGYQAVRLFHYLDENEQGILFFEDQLESLKYHSQFYYWILEQAAGMYRANGLDAKASYYYGLVFNYCKARRDVALLSYRITSQNIWDEAQAMCETSEEKAALFTMRAMQPYGYSLEEMENIYRFYPESSFLDLLLMREVKKYEADLLRRIWLGNKNTLQPSDYRKADNNPPLLEFITFCQIVVAEGKRSDAENWEFALGYLEFLRRDFDKADRIFTNLRERLADSTLVLDVELFQFVASLASLEKVQKEKENDLYKNYERLRIDLKAAGRKVDYKNLEDYFLAEMGHLFLKQWQMPGITDSVALAKAYLCGQNIGTLKSNLELAIVKGIQKFVNQKSNTNLEAMLQKRTEFENRDDFLLELEGTAYLKLAISEPVNFSKNLGLAQRAFEKMATSLDKIGMGERTDYWEAVPADGRMFTAFVRDIFNNPDPQDGYKLWQGEDWLDREFTKLELVVAIFKLDSLSDLANEEAARYSFLMGNLLYNLTCHGVYRHVLHYEETPRFAGRLAWWGWGGTSVSERYNFEHYRSGSFLVNTELARKYYQKALNTTRPSAEEFNAWCTFMLAKCDQVRLINEGKGPKYDNLYLNEDDRPFMVKFHEEYEGTELYKEAYERCSYLRLYSNR